MILDRLLKDHYDTMQINLDWSSKVFAFMEVKFEKACSSLCYFEFGQTCQFYLAMENVCYFGNFSHFDGFNHSINFINPPIIFWKTDQLKIPPYTANENQASEGFASKIYDIEEVEDEESCKYYCVLVGAKPCGFYVFWDGKCFLGNMTDPADYNLTSNLPSPVTIHAILDSRKF